jgi:hypothetical protein
MLRILGQRAHDRDRERRGELGRDFARVADLELAAEARRVLNRHVEEPLAGEELPKNDAGRVDVARTRSPLPSEELGREIADFAADAAGRRLVGRAP